MVYFCCHSSNNILQTIEELSNLISSSVMNEQIRPLRKVVSDVSSEIEKYIALESCALVEEQLVKQAECECCGLKEDCTADYITRVKGCHCGKWVCGLCSEVVKERICRAPKTTVQDAMSFHREFCQRFNTTTRLNPKLSLTSAMRDIAKRSCQNRSSKNLSAPNIKIARSISCVPRIDLKD